MKRMVVLILLSYTFINAQVPYNQEFLVNTYTEDYQYNGHITMLSDSGFVICWQSGKPQYLGAGPDGSGFGIFAKIYNIDGTMRVNEFQVNTFALDDQINPRVAQLVHGGFVICWVSQAADGSSEIYAQIFNNDGTKRGNEFLVNTNDDRSQLSPDVTGLVDGSFVVCWQSGMDNTIGNVNGHAKIFSDDGSIRTDEFRISNFLSGHEFSTRIAGISNGGFAICWVTDNRDGNDRGIFACVFNANGSSTDDDFLVNTTTLDWQYNPSIAALSDSGFVICWQGKDRSGQGIFGQIFNNNGENCGTEFQINTNESSDQTYPCVASLKAGGFVVTYYSHSNPGTIAQLYKYDGSKKGNEFYAANGHPDGIADFCDNGFIMVFGRYSEVSSSDIFYIYYKNEINHPLKTFSLEFPHTDATIHFIIQSLIWRKASLIRLNIPWELEYILFLDEDENFSSPLVIDSIYDTTYTVQNLTPGKTYFWKVLAKNIAGDSLWSSETNLFYVSEDATGIKHQTTNYKSQTFELYDNYPNPFNPETTIKYNLPADKSVYSVKIKIYDALGRLITTLKNEQQNPGLHSVKWNGKNMAGQSMPSGIYFCVVEAGQYKAIQKMLLVR